MGRWDGVSVRRVLLHAGIVVVAALWVAEEAGWIRVSGSGVPVEEDLPPPAAEALGLVAQGVIVGNGATPGVVILSDNGRPPEMVSEGQAYHEDLRVEHVLADRVILRQRDDNTPIVLAIVPPAASPRAGGDAAANPANPAGTAPSTPAATPPTEAAAAAPAR
ncbi:hypothetical protein [Zoogloea sp. LCSB751]|uniref:hypothetical protein n=1 Tax=Zoogloea sp. LCSB751 TaxID=1965277 RepID=UPI00111797AE|nr:hypothetical protein [Zoogloea sp. LCSB751]